MIGIILPSIFAYAANEEEADKNLVYEEIQKLKLTDITNGGSGWDSSLNPDLIEASEVADIVGYSGFTNTNE